MHENDLVREREREKVDTSKVGDSTKGLDIFTLGLFSLWTPGERKRKKVEAKYEELEDRKKIRTKEAGIITGKGRCNERIK